MASNSFSGSLKRRIIVDDDSECSDDDTTSSCEIQYRSKTPQEKDGSLLPSSATTAKAKTKGASTERRKHSFGSILTDSSGELEELFRQTSICKKLLAKPPTEINVSGFDGSSDEDSVFESEKENKTRKTPALAKSKDDHDDDDPESAWCRKEGSDDFYLSRQKRSDVDWPELCLPGALYHQLYNFQRQGVQWMATLHSGGIGGILGDDMGMGKTYMLCSYLGALMRAGTIRNALVIAPLSVLRSWEKEAQKILHQCVKSFKVTIVNSEMSRSRRLDFISSLAKTKGQNPIYNLVITTYGLVRSATADFTSPGKTVWHYVALDEGHTIKNATAETSQACRAICSPDTRRLLLTGTPILNNLKELWSLLDFATRGLVLGNSKSFTQYFARHIEEARDRLATVGTIELGQRKNKELQELIRPYFLQRLKIDFLKDKLPEKHDVVVWTHLSEEQRQRYTEFVESKDSIVRSILTGSKQSPLEAITWLKTLCGHPLLTEAVGKKMNTILRHKNSRDVLRQSAKLQVLVDLVQHLKDQRHRMLIFSQSTKMLDTINFVLGDRFALARIDGSTPEKDRQYLVDSFNREDSRFDAMLLSTKAAGCGLTLIGADTSIIYDPSWTPAEDAQAVDRCYRIGQTKEVTVYRLIAAGTVEEKTYEKQVYKEGIRRAVLSNDENVTRYFERDELRALFTLGEPGVCRVFEKFKHMVDIDRYEFVYDLEGVIGISPHDGFYLKDCENKRGAFNGPVKQAPPKTLGKSQRVMARAMKSDLLVVEGQIQKMSLKDDGSLADSEGKAGAMKTFGQSATRNENIPTGSAPKIARGASATKANLPATQKMLNSVSNLIERGHKRKALEILIDLVECGGLKGDRKLEVHKQIASLGRDLELH